MIILMSLFLLVMLVFFPHLFFGVIFFVFGTKLLFTLIAYLAGVLQYGSFRPSRWISDPYDRYRAEFQRNLDKISKAEANRK
jgi:hypothetical protein